VRRSILLDSKADILVYGMGEAPLREIAKRLAGGVPAAAIQDVWGTCVRSRTCPSCAEELPDYEAVKGRDEFSFRSYAENFMIQKHASDPAAGKTIA
jgi:radical SAM superfamily enzyme YgiQ (UPF0313 family)